MNRNWAAGPDPARLPDVFKQFDAGAKGWFDMGRAVAQARITEVTSVRGGQEMSDVVVRVDLESAAEESVLAQAIDAFTRWRSETCPADDTCRDAPEIMVKTSWRHDSLEKTLIFQDRRWAAAFLKFWRVERRRAN